MNHFNVTPLCTSYKAQNEPHESADQMARAAHSRGVEFGQKLGEQAVDRALGVGLCFGVALGVLVTLLAQDWIKWWLQ